MIPLTFLLIKRFILGNHRQNSIPRTVLLSFLIIIIVTFSSAMIISIMNGFEEALYKSLQGMHADIIMEFPDNTRLPEIVQQLQLNPQIDNVSWHTSEHVLIRSKKNELVQVGLLRGIQLQHSKNNYIGRILIDPPHSTSIDLLLTKNHIFIGTSLAEQLECKINDSVEILISTDYQPVNKKLLLDSYQAVIAGVFKTGIDEFDDSMIFCNLDFFDELFPESKQTTVSISLINKQHEVLIIKNLKNRYNVPIYTWKDLYPALLSALKLERYVMVMLFILLLFLVCAIVSSNSSMLVLRKQKDIALLKAFGASSLFITVIFLIISAVISVVGSVIGLLSAYFFGSFLYYTPISLPQAYLVDQLPIKLEFSIFLYIFIGMILVTGIASFIGMQQIRRSSINNLIRSEHF